MKFRLRCGSLKNVVTSLYYVVTAFYLLEDLRCKCSLHSKIVESKLLTFSFLLLVQLWCNCDKTSCRRLFQRCDIVMFCSQGFQTVAPFFILPSAQRLGAVYWQRLISEHKYFTSIFFSEGEVNFETFIYLSVARHWLVSPGEPEHRHQRRREGHEAGSDQWRGQDRGKSRTRNEYSFLFRSGSRWGYGLRNQLAKIEV